MENISRVFRKSSTVALSKTCIMLTIKWLLKSDLVLLFLPLLSSEKLWVAIVKTLLVSPTALFLTGNISHRYGNFLNLRELNCTQELCKKTNKKPKTKKKFIYIGHCAHSRLKDNRSSLPGLLIEKQYHNLGMRALVRLITLFLCAVEGAPCNTEEHFKENVSPQ